VRGKANQFTLETEFSSGPVAEADLTVRIPDYHVIEENFRFKDHSELDIAELSYAVLPFAALPKGIFELPASVALPQLSVASALRILAPTDAELVAAEVQAESVLHKLGGDLGEQIDVSILPAREVLIQGVVADDARKQQLLAALQGISHARLHLLTVAEVAQQSSISSAAAAGRSPTPSVQVMVAAPALLDAELNARFPDKDQRIAYVNQTLSLAQQASARAWALNRLADRHPLQNDVLLDGAARQELHVLLTDHVSVLREDLSSLQNRLAEIISMSSNTPAANTAFPADSTETPEVQRDWRERVRRVHSSTENINEAVVTLLTSSPPSSRNNVEAIEINLRTTLTQIQTELQVLNQTLRKANSR
jgi:hypothetical protein